MFERILGLFLNEWTRNPYAPYTIYCIMELLPLSFLTPLLSDIFKIYLCLYFNIFISITSAYLYPLFEKFIVIELILTIIQHILYYGAYLLLIKSLIYTIPKIIFNLLPKKQRPLIHPIN